MPLRSRSSCNQAIDWQQRRQEIATGALKLYLERPWPHLSIEDISAELGLSYWQVYYSFDGREDIYRTAVSQIVNSIAFEIARRPKPCPSINQTIRHYVRYCAHIVAHENYKTLLFLRIRDEIANPLLAMTYERKVAFPLRSGLEQSVYHAGDLNNLNLIILHGACERFLTALERSLAFPKLLKSGPEYDPDFEKIVSETTKEISSMTCSFDGFRNNENYFQSRVES